MEVKINQNKKIFKINPQEDPFYRRMQAKAKRRRGIAVNDEEDKLNKQISI